MAIKSARLNVGDNVWRLAIQRQDGEDRLVAIAGVVDRKAPNGADITFPADLLRRERMSFRKPNQLWHTLDDLRADHPDTKITVIE